MADMFDCGYHTHKAWSEGRANLVRDLGPYNPAATREYVDAALEHDRHTTDGIAAFWRGFDSFSQAVLA